VAATILVTEYGLKVARACRIVRFSRAAYYRDPRSAVERDRAVIAALERVVERHPRSGFWKCFGRLRRQGHGWNHKRVHRVYCALKLNLPRRTKRRLPTRLRQPLEAPRQLNGIWAIDFMADALYGGRKIRTLNVIDEGNREALAIDVALSIPSVRVIRVLQELVAVHGRPAALRVDNGPELISEAFLTWCGEQRIEVRHIQPGKPDQNAFIERFNRSYRHEVLDAYVFDSIDEVQQVTDEWLEDYNSERPHDSLGQVPPRSFLPRPDRPLESSYQVST
jgi:putative transposase